MSAMGETHAAGQTHAAGRAAAAKANVIDFYRWLVAWSGSDGALRDRDGVLLYSTATRFPVTMNGAVRVDPEVPDDVVLDIADGWFAERGRGFTLQVQDPDGIDAGLVETAEARGLLTVGRAPAMICRSRLDDAVAPSGVELCWLGGSGARATELADAFVSVSDRAYQSLGMTAGAIDEALVRRDRFGGDGVRTVVAVADGEPLAAAQLILTVLDDGTCVGGVYFVGTVEAARGTGLGELVTRAVTNEGFDLGATFASLQATEMGEPIYRRLGYELLCRYRSLVRF